MRPRVHVGVAALGMAMGVFSLLVPVTPGEGTGAAASVPQAACTWNFTIDAIEGAHGSASAIGWAGNHQGVTTCLGGSFYVLDGINKTFGFGIYSPGARTTWTDADGYLPAQITSFTHDGARVAITEFADEVDLGGRRFVAVYCRVDVTNQTSHAVDADPDPSAGLLALATAPDTVGAGRRAVFDYVMAVDRFGNSYPWPSASALQAAGSFDTHFAHMRAFWDSQLAGIAGVQVPDRQLVNAFKSGFIATQIARSGVDLDTGVNGYQSEFSHDVIGILVNLFTQGYFVDAHGLLTEARNVVGSQGQYQDGLWTYAWPWAVYLLKTGDLSFVKANFATSGPGGASEPSIMEAAHQIAADRTGPGGIMGTTDDIDTEGLWTVDDYEALTGLAAYGYVAARVGDTQEALWATAQYNSLLAAVNTTLDATIERFHLTYLPCSMVQPDKDNRCRRADDANWAATLQFGHWAWDGLLLGVPRTGPGVSLIDATYDYGFARLHGILPSGTYGGYPGDYYDTAYDAGYGTWGLASTDHRDQGILGYEFMIAHSQSGPYAWWESSSAPSASPWVGTHPSSGQGSSPHAWGMAEANKVLLDSIAAQTTDGSLIVGRGIPDAWLRKGAPIGVTNFPTEDGQRISVHITGAGTTVQVTVVGRPSGPVLVELPAFEHHNIASASGGTVERAEATVRLAPRTHAVVVHLRHAV